MRKDKFMKITMVFLPFAAMMLSGGPTAVTVFDSGRQVTTSGSFFTPIDGAPLGFCLLLSALFCGLCLTFSVARLIREKVWMRKAVMAVSFAAMTLAVVPLLIRESIIVLPNMLFPILMGVETLMSYVQIRKQGAETNRRTL